MKQLTIFVIALLAFSITAGAQAKGNGHGHGHGVKHGHYKKHQYKYYGPYRGPRYYRGYYRPRYYPSYLGAALIGSALRYSLYHTHNGAYCYENHGNDNYQPTSNSYTEVVGCHRMERLPDGTERRVEVPLSECN